MNKPISFLIALSAGITVFCGSTFAKDQADKQPTIQSVQVKSTTDTHKKMSPKLQKLIQYKVNARVPAGAKIVTRDFKNRPSVHADSPLLKELTSKK